MWPVTVPHYLLCEYCISITIYLKCNIPVNENTELLSSDLFDSTLFLGDRKVLGPIDVVADAGTQYKFTQIIDQHTCGICE